MNLILGLASYQKNGGSRRFVTLQRLLEEVRLPQTTMRIGMGIFRGLPQQISTPTDITKLKSPEISETSSTITNEGLGAASTYVLPAYSVLMTSRATIGACAVNTVPMATNQGFQSLVPGESLNTWYLFYQMLNQASFLESLGAGSTFSEVSKSVVEKVEIPIPPLDEQRKIASVLLTVDRAIQTTEAIIAQAKRVKRGLMQDLFTCGLQDEKTQETRLGKFPQSWELTTLGKVAHIERGNTPDTSTESYFDGDTVWVTPNDLSNLYENGDGKYISDSERRLSESGVRSKSLNLVKPNSVMFTSRSYGIGKTAICTVPAAMNQGITAFECSEHLDEEYLYYYLNYVMEYIVSISGVATFPEITKSEVAGIPIPVPDLDTQKRIAGPLKAWDEEINEEKELKDQLAQLKKGLMQDLLTGRVRTTGKNIDVLGEVEAHG